MRRSIHPRSLLFVLALGVLPFLAAPAEASEPPVTGGPSTQVIHLETGINWVGLGVHPETTDIGELLAPISDDLVLVKDLDGPSYLPEFDAGTLTHWHWNRGYVVKVAEPTTLTITGALIVAAASMLSLDAGWTLVPFFGDEPLPAAQAFSSLGEHLDRVEDADGNVYSPGDSNPTLEFVEPGHAYNIRLTAPATLIYGGNFGDVVATRAQLLALPTSDLELGTTVMMAGYHTPDDGGGGVFTLVDEGDWGCDAGYVLCPLDQLGPVVTDNTVFSESQSHRTFHVSQPPVAYGTLTMTLEGSNAGGEPWSISIPDDYMHGTTYQTRHEWLRTFNHQTGYFNEHRGSGGRPMTMFLPGHLGSGWSLNAEFSYRQVEGDLRWLRTHDADGLALPTESQVWDARWFGCRSHDDAPYFDNTNCLNWALILARYTNEANPGRVADVRLSHNGAGPTTYYYSKSIQIPEGMALTGDAGAHVVSAVDEFANEYWPVRPRPDAVTLKMLPEHADECSTCSHVFDHIDMRRPYGDPHHLPPSPMALLGNYATNIQPQSGISNWAVRDLVLDGNKEGQDIRANRFTHANRENFLRNSPSYSGIAQSNHGGKDIIGQSLTIERTYVTGYAATGLITMIGSDTTYVRDVSVGDAAWNHAAYLLGPIDAVNMGAHGEAWGHFEIYGGRFENLVAENLAPGRSGAHGIFSWRGGDYDTVDACHDQSSRPCGTSVQGLYADMKGSNRTLATQGLGPGINIYNAIILTDDNGSPTELWRENGNGYQSARYHDFHYRTINHYVRGGTPGQYAIAGHNFGKSSFQDLQVVVTELPSREWDNCIHMRSNSRGDVDDPPYEVVYDGIGSAEMPIRCRSLARGRFSAGQFAHHFFIVNSFIANSDHGVMRGGGGTGRLSSVCDDEAVCDQLTLSQVYLHNTEVAARGNRHRDGELFFEVARFNEVVDPETGASSEDSGSFTCDGSSMYDIQTNLFWRPHATRGRFDTSNGPTVESVDYVNEDGQSVGPSYLGYPEADARRPMARITFSAPCAEGTQIDWDAAVSEWVDHDGEPVGVPDWYTD